MCEKVRVFFGNPVWYRFGRIIESYIIVAQVDPVFNEIMMLHTFNLHGLIVFEQQHYDSGRGSPGLLFGFNVNFVYVTCTYVCITHESGYRSVDPGSVIVVYHFMLTKIKRAANFSPTKMAAAEVH